MVLLLWFIICISPGHFINICKWLCTILWSEPKFISVNCLSEVTKQGKRFNQEICVNTEASLNYWIYKYRFFRGKSRTANAQLVHLTDIYHNLKLEVAATFTYRLSSKMCGLCWVIMENLKNIDKCQTNRASLTAAIITRILMLQKLYHAKKINNYLWLKIDCSTLILSHAPFL